MAFTGHESTEELKFQFARRLYTAVVLNASILKVKDVLKIPDIEKIVITLKKRSQWTGVRSFLQLYPCFFLLTEESGSAVIKPIVTIEFCRDFDGKKGCTRGFCSKLHVCRHFVKGKCTFGPRCKKPHHFQSGPTREVLKKHFLDELTDEQAREFLCRNVQHLLDPESTSGELPKCLEICKYYNVATGCTREFCPYIHVCRFYAEEGNCKFGSQCIRKHDINNVHSRILLHRYHMDHLNDQQVIAYLKIKGENREQQSQQQQQQQPPNIKVEKRNSQVSPPNLLTSFSLPTGIMSNMSSMHASLVNDIGRKLSTPNAPPMNTLSLVEDGVSLRKLSLPNTPMNRTTNFRPPVTHEESSTHSQTSKIVGSYISCHNNETRGQGSRTHEQNFVGSFNSSMDDRFKNHSELLKYKSRFHSENSLQHTSPTLSRHSVPSSPHISKSYTDSMAQNPTNELHHQLSLNNDSQFSKPTSYESLGLHNLSPPLTNITEQLANTLNINTTNGQNQQKFSKSKSFENFSSQDVDKNNMRNGMSKSVQSSYLPYTNSIQNQTHSFFTSRVPFMRASSNDSLSYTDSTTSTNNDTTSTSFNDWYDGANIFKTFKTKDEEGEFILSYHRSQSLPNFNVQKSNNNVVDSNIPIDSPQGHCTCQKNLICIFNLKGVCRYNSCKKAHVDDSFQWQISSTPLPKTQNSYKNENFDNQIKKRWINIEKNENMKLESAYCSAELDEREIEIYGDSILVNFNDMIASARMDMNSTNHIPTQRSCDLSAWLLQANDDTPTRRSSFDAVIYSVRRISTPSTAECDEFDAAYATHWLWYWQDNFGIWRNYPQNKADVIEANNICYSDELESKFLEDHDHYIFEHAGTIIDFKQMIQVNSQSKKQRKIRRRPQFICKDQREQFGGFSDSPLQMNDVRRPWYWNQESTVKANSYELVDVDLSSDMFAHVRDHFMRSLADKSYELIGIKSIRNMQLWTKFISLRSQLDKADIKYVEKFGFKSVLQQHLSGTCQQGFQICSCKQKKIFMSQENVFATEASQALNALTEENNEDGLRYMFCVRMTLPATDLSKFEEGKINGTSEDTTLLSHGLKNANSDSLVLGRHTYQIYPEFLIIFKV